MSPEARVGPFRKEAMEARFSSEPRYGQVLKLAPQWVHAGFWVAAAVVLSLLAFLTFARVGRHVRGQALVTATTKHLVTAASSGVITQLYVRPGERVSRGQSLARLSDDAEAAALQQASNDFERELARALLAPGDATRRTPLPELEGRLLLARQRFEQRTLVAPAAGVINDVWLPVGRSVELGAQLLTIVEPSAGFRLLVLLPGSSSPDLHPGLPLTVQLAGREGYFPAQLVEVSRAVVGPSEARRILGQSADAVALDQAVSLVTADLPPELDVRELRDGMVGSVFIELAPTRLGFLLFPWLARL